MANSANTNTRNILLVNGVNQLTTVVQGIDERRKGSSMQNKYYMGQSYNSPAGAVDYDLYYLYTNLETDWSALQPGNPLWNDITFTDVRVAESAYPTCTDKQKYNIDWVRGLAEQQGYIYLFCIDEPDWACAMILPIDTDPDVGYEIAEIDFDDPDTIVNTYYSAAITDADLPFAGVRQKVSSLLLK
jgi:hypothetical protein